MTEPDLELKIKQLQVITTGFLQTLKQNPCFHCTFPGNPDRPSTTFSYLRGILKRSLPYTQICESQY
jgi:hypothetical protein